MPHALLEREPWEHSDRVFVTNLPFDLDNVDFRPACSICGFWGLDTIAVMKCRVAHAVAAAQRASITLPPPQDVDQQN